MRAALASLRRRFEDAWRLHRTVQRFLARNLPLLAKLAVTRARGGAWSGVASAEDARMFTLSLEEMGIFFVKIGQVLSSRFDLLPHVVCVDLGRLHNRTRKVPDARMMKILHSELGSVRWDNFYVECIASASVSQCYAAEVAGQPVVVKVLKPGVAAEVQRDTRILRYIALVLEASSPRFAALQTSEHCDELAEALTRECDFEQERGALVKFGALLDDIVTVPRPLEHLCSPSVLTMSYVPGKPITEAAADMDADERRDRVSRLMQSLFRMLFCSSDGTYHADLHPGNVLAGPRGQLAIIDFGLIGRLSHVQRTRLLLILTAMRAGKLRVAAWLVLGACTRAPRSREARLRLVAVLETTIRRFLDSQLAGADTTEHVLKALGAINDAGAGLPRGYYMLYRSFCSCEGIARALAPDLDVVACAVPALTRALASGMLSPCRLALSARDIICDPDSSAVESAGRTRDAGILRNAIAICTAVVQALLRSS